MKRLFLVYDEKDFAEWIEEELTEYGRFIRSIESLDFFFPQWNAVGSADVIILPETVIRSQESFMNLYQTVKSESPETIFLLIYHREKDAFVDTLMAEGNVCISYDDLDTGLLEQRLRNGNETLPNPSPIETIQPLTMETVFVQTEEPILGAEEPASIVQSNPYAEDNLITLLDHEIEPATEEIVTAIADKHENENVLRMEYVSSENASEPNGMDHYGGQRRVLSQPAPTPSQEVVEMKSSSEQKVDQKPAKKRRSSEEQKAKLQRIKERIVIEEKIVTVHVPVHFNSLLVSIVSLYPRAGATFVTANFARMLGENKVPVSVLEPVFPHKGSTYYELMYGEKNAPKQWKSWAERLLTQGYISQENNWNHGGVVWIPSNTEGTPSWTEEKTMQLLLAAKRFPVTLCDVSSNHHEPQSKKILSMSDEIWIVADGDPIQLSHHYKTIDAFKTEYPGKPLKVIGNKWNEYIKQSEWKEAVLLPILTQIPDLGPIVLKHLWDGKMAWDDSKLKNTLSSPFKPMARSVMAKEMYNMIKKQYGFGAKLNGFFRQMKSLDDEVKDRKM